MNAGTFSPVHRWSVLLMALSSLVGLYAVKDRDVIADTVGAGKVSLNFRTCYEDVDQTGVRNTTALAARTRLKFTSAPVRVVSASLRAENIIALDGDK